MLGLSFGLSCSMESPINQNTDQSVYFDIPSYFENEIAQRPWDSMRKTVEFNNQVEEYNPDQFDIYEELKETLELQINKPAWIGKFKVDSIVNDKQQLEAVIYNTEEDNIAIKEVELLYDKGKDTPTTLRILREQSSLIYQRKQWITYNKGEEIEIKNESKSVRDSATQILKINYLF